MYVSHVDDVAVRQCIDSNLEGILPSAPGNQIQWPDTVGDTAFTIPTSSLKLVLPAMRPTDQKLTLDPHGLSSSTAWFTRIRYSGRCLKG